MFDVYLDTGEFSNQTPYNNYTVGSWAIPEVNWSAVKSLNNTAILYRTHSQSRAIEEIFLKYHLPYKLVSGTRFLDRREIKDVMSILRYLSNGEDKISLSRFLPLILPGVGPKTLQKIIAYLDDFTYPLPPKNQKQILGVIESFQSVWQNHSNLIDLTKALLDVSGYLVYLKSQYPSKEEYEARLENIGELYSLMFQFDEQKEVPLKERLTQFLIHVSLMSAVDNSQEDNTPKISLMSLHQSKGLEFETVFLVGIEDGLLPHQNSFFEEGGMEEEVRLAYVGVTRAKQNLYLISADSRVQFGQIKANPISRIFRPFLDTHIKRSK
jgi:DNA helicase-2/ATP-dependent DNA helicase PcrA